MGTNPLNFVRRIRTVLQRKVGFHSRLMWQRLSVGRDERSPVVRAEYILRRVHKNNFKPSTPDPILRPAFAPSNDDIDGLSIHRELFITPRKLAFCGRKPGEYLIVRLQISELEQFGLSCQPSPDPDQPAGHAIIPQLNSFEQKSGKSKELQRALAKIAKDRIVFKPDGL